MRIRVTSFVLAALVVISPVIAAEDPRFGPEGQKQIVELTHQLEAKPFSDKAGSIRTKVLEWWIENPDLTLNWCAGMLIDGKNKKISPAVVTQGLFGAGVFLLENPSRVEDEVELHLAGIQSALRLYQGARNQNKKMKDKFYERLVEMEEAGTLRSWVEQKVLDCHEADRK